MVWAHWVPYPELSFFWSGILLYFAFAVTASIIDRGPTKWKTGEMKGNMGYI